MGGGFVFPTLRCGGMAHNEPAEATASWRAVADATPPPLVRDLRIVFPNKDVTGEIVAVACIDPRFRISARDGRWPTLEKCWYL